MPDETGLSEEQQEIIGLLTGEIQELSNNECARLNELDALPATGDELPDLLFELYKQLEHISNALDIAGLTGLSITGKLISENIKELCSCQTEASQEQVSLAAQCGPLFLAYLTTIGEIPSQSLSEDESEEQSCAMSLIEFLDNSIWPKALCADKKIEITELFHLSGLSSLLDDEVDTTPEFASPEMCSLELDDDIRPELLQGLLIELPQQVEQFETSLNCFLDTRNFDDLNQAQRIAHTIKGAANVVSVSGLANLMHFTEDLLETAAKQWQTPPDGFDDFLQSVADGLATITEFLNQFGPEPDNIEELMNELLAWLRQAKHGTTIDRDNDVDISAKFFDQEKSLRDIDANISNNDSDEGSHPSPIHTTITASEDFENKGAVPDKSEKFSPDVKPTTEVYKNSLAEEYKEPSSVEQKELSDDEQKTPATEVPKEPSSHNNKEPSENSIKTYSQNISKKFAESVESTPEKTQIQKTSTLETEVQKTQTHKAPDAAEQKTEIKNKEKEEEIQARKASDPATEKPTLRNRKIQPPVEKSSVRPNEDDVRYINLPNHVAQELLRLSGETQITNNQFSVRVENLQHSTQLSDRYHKQIKTMAAEFDALVQTQSALRSASLVSQEDQLDPLEMEQFNELHSFSHQLLELTTDSYESIVSLESQLNELSALLYSQQQLNHDSQQILLDMNLLPVSTFASRFSRCVRQACRLTHKSAKLDIIGGQLMMDSHVLNAISDPIMHILRNAVDHGLESSRAEREEKNKPPEGKIILSFMSKGDTIVVECRDDGRGLNYDAIYQTALDKKLISVDTKNSPKLLNQMILMPGFSTRKEATQTSGRGIGLDAVMASVRSLKGNMKIQSDDNKGCCISLTVPSSILTAHAIVIKNNYRNETQSFSILGRAVDQIIYVRPDQISRGANGHMYQHQGKNIPVYPLNDLLGYGAGDINATNALLLCKKTDGEQVFIAVEQIVASQELVIKSLNEYTYLPEGVVGATILGDGTISPAIDLQELPGMSLDQDALVQLRKRREQFSALEKASYKEPPAALVVDDSLSARRSLAQFVSDLGMEVYTAKDGFDAIQAIEAKKPSLLLVDLEMPRMNGLELTAHLRSREEYKDIPVIMITSRSTDHHKTLAKNAGVDTYLTKPWSEEELMRCIEKQIA